MRMKRFAVMALTAALSVGSVMTASAAWLQDGGNWRYQNDNGTFQTGTWFQDVDGKWYHFDNNGNMQKGWFLDADGKWYFMAYHGAMQTGLIRVDNAVYFMNPSGDLFIGEKAINGVTYNFGLYGTTNGTPSVGQSATFGGNGNQTKPGGGSGSGSDYTPAPEEKVETVVENVTKAADTAKEKSGGTIKDIVVGKPENAGTDSAKVKVEVKAVENLNLGDNETRNNVVSAVAEVVTSVVSEVDEGSPVTVDIPGVDLPDTPITADMLTEDRVNQLLDKYVTPETYKNASSATVTVEIEGVAVTYTITLSK